MPRHFTTEDLEWIYDQHPLKKSTILARIEKEKGSLAGLTELDLALDERGEITDQNHIGGFGSLKELAERAGVTASSFVLDVGCGLGGSSRALAHLYGCRVHGVEITKQRYADAVDLTAMVGLETLVTFTHGDFMTADLSGRRFDIILAQSALVHFSDKDRLAARFVEHLKNDGRLAMEETCLRRPPFGDEEKRQVSELEDAWKSYLVSSDEWLTSLRGAGFSILLNEDLTRVFQEYYSGLLAIVDASPPGSFSDNEVAGISRAVALASAGVVGYARTIASVASHP